MHYYMKRRFCLAVYSVVTSFLLPIDAWAGILLEGSAGAAHERKFSDDDYALSLSLEYHQTSSSRTDSYTVDAFARVANDWQFKAYYNNSAFAPAGRVQPYSSVHIKYTGSDVCTLRATSPALSVAGKTLLVNINVDATYNKYGHGLFSSRSGYISFGGSITNLNLPVVGDANIGELIKIPFNTNESGQFGFSFSYDFYDLLMSFMSNDGRPLPSHSTGDLSHTISLESITFEDGSTPEENGYELVFQSGRRSPNLAVPEPAQGSLAAMICLFSATKGTRTPRQRTRSWRLS